VMYDLGGRIIKVLHEFNMTESMDVNQLSPGLYIFEIRYQNTLVSKLKFIKQ